MPILVNAGKAFDKFNSIINFLKNLSKLEQKGSSSTW